jgi:hypothetical protein
MISPAKTRKNEPDGSSRIAAGPKAIPGVHEFDWPPAPVGRPFSPTLRTHVPNDAMKCGAPRPLTLQP